mmetsp:Transcript_3694/g.6315  ORF Transcript_3694/g.6315 Transcript_3694/m.6315 type:complete len:238 (-) Transcript_3694:218-931(-)
MSKLGGVSTLLLFHLLVLTTVGFAPSSHVAFHPSLQTRSTLWKTTNKGSNKNIIDKIVALRLADVPSTGEEEELGSYSNQNKSVLTKIKDWFLGTKDDGLTAKQRLAKMGLAALLSYGWISNLSYAVSLSLAWFLFSRKTKLSPLAPGQWKPFLAVYTGFFVFNNIIRPIRFGLAVGVARYFDNAIAFTQNKARVSKTVAVGIVVFCANILGTFAMMGTGIFLASLAAGVPILPPPK